MDLYGRMGYVSWNARLSYAASLKGIYQMNTPDWIYSLSFRRELERVKDQYFAAGYLIGGLVGGGATWLFHMWGII